LFVYIFVLHIVVSFARMELNYHRRASGLLLMVSRFKLLRIPPLCGMYLNISKALTRYCNSEIQCISISPYI